MVTTEKTLNEETEAVFAAELEAFWEKIASKLRQDDVLSLMQEDRSEVGAVGTYLALQLAIADVAAETCSLQEAITKWAGIYDVQPTVANLYNAARAAHSAHKDQHDFLHEQIELCWDALQQGLAKRDRGFMTSLYDRFSTRINVVCGLIGLEITGAGASTRKLSLDQALQKRAELNGTPVETVDELHKKISSQTGLVEVLVQWLVSSMSPAKQNAFSPEEIGQHMADMWTTIQSWPTEDDETLNAHVDAALAEHDRNTIAACALLRAELRARKYDTADLSLEKALALLADEQEGDLRKKRDDLIKVAHERQQGVLDTIEREYQEARRCVTRTPQELYDVGATLGTS